MEDKERSTGRTIRIVDKLIQELFTKGWCVCKDHYDTPESSRLLADKVLRRLTYEHSQKAIVSYGANHPYIELNKKEG